MELVDIADLKSVGISRASSSLAGPIKGKTYVERLSALLDTAT